MHLKLIQNIRDKQKQFLATDFSGPATVETLLKNIARIATTTTVNSFYRAQHNPEPQF